MKVSRLALITLILNTSTSLAAVAAWASAVSGQELNILSYAGLLGLIAFSLMWVHFASDVIRDIWLPRQTAGYQYKVSRWIVLSAILLHPSLIVTYLYQNGYGLPPESYEAYLGETKALFVFFGVLGLTIFLAFECKRQLLRRGLWHYILHANFIAMFAILIHGFRLGSVMDTPWYFALWCFYAISLVAIAARWYVHYYRGVRTRTILALSIISLFAVVIAFAALQSQSERQKSTAKATSASNNALSLQSSQQTTLDAISGDQLAKNNGKNNTSCWIAIDGIVYDVSNSPEWVNGQHVPSRGMASCGRDLTAVIAQSPHGKSVLGELPRIGKLQN